MVYRELGKTGLQVSVIGLGCEHLDGKPFSQIDETVNTALDHGVNILDVFMPGKKYGKTLRKLWATDVKKLLYRDI